MPTMRDVADHAGVSIATVSRAHRNADLVAPATRERVHRAARELQYRPSRLGRSLVTDSELLSLDQILAEIEAVDPESVAQLAAMLLAPEKLSVAGIGTNEERFRAATARVAPHLAEAKAA